MTYPSTKPVSATVFNLRLIYEHNKFFFLVGIGRGVVEALSKAGAEVWAISRTKKGLDKLEKEVII